MLFSERNNSSGKAVKMRFTSLDAVRGLTAIAVMFLHYSGLSGLNWLPRAWMAVDVFFIISGFVLMHSYAKKIENRQLNFLGFLKTRLARLMPLFVVGLLLGCLSMMYSCRLSGGTCNSSILPAMLHGLFMLPYFNDAMWPIGIRVSQYYFPLNQPGWSLFFELFINIVFFYWIVSTKAQHLLKLVVFGFIALIVTYFFHGSINVGFAVNDNFYWGFTRVFYHFFIGVFIYTQYEKYGLNSRLIAFISVTLLLASFLLNSSLVSMFTLFILAPFTVLANAKITFKGYAERVCTWLGDISYPLYIVHWPIFQLLYLFGHLEGLSLPVRVVVMGIITIIFAWLLAMVDKNVREKLKKI